MALTDNMVANANDGEANFITAATVEGRATSVQIRWMMANGVTPTAPGSTELLDAVPATFVNDLTLHYNCGAGHVDASGGPAETWGLYEEPPVSSELILFPDTSETEQIFEVDIPEADGEVLSSGVFGAADLLMFLVGDTYTPDPDLIMTAMGAADGWAGGSIVLWGDDSESCVRIAVATDTAVDGEEITAALADWLSGSEGRTIETTAEGDILITGCAPFLS